MPTQNETLGAKARRLIPGGAHTYSKGDDQFPANAPRIISHGKGAYLWDVDNNKYVDMAMSLGTVLLGHAYDPILDAVRAELSKGVNFCRPSYLEAELAEILTETVPSAEMAKFAKNGSDATTAAIRLARAFTGRDLIIRCADDPFNAVHDWFIGSTVMNCGVPNAVKGLTLKFEYNNLPACEQLFEAHPNQIAAVLLEPVSMIEPKEGFLEGLKNLCEKNGAILIFDEVVSGFRFSLGGAQEMVGVKPHLTALGKGMANGFAVSALVGLREIMEIGGIDHQHERVFLLSTTHGGETHALAAAKATINEIRERDLISHFWHVGRTLMDGTRNLSAKLGIEEYVDVFGYPCKPGLAFRDQSGEVSMKMRTLFLQETIRHGLLIPYIVPSFCHGEKELDFALSTIDKALTTMKDAIESGDIENRLLGPAVKPVFRKFN